jgi:hypothetical protein
MGMGMGAADGDGSWDFLGAPGAPVADGAGQKLSSRAPASLALAPARVGAERGNSSLGVKEEFHK